MSGNTQQVRLLARHRPPVVSGFFVLWIMPERARNVVRRLRHPSMDSPSPSGVRECRLASSRLRLKLVSELQLSDHRISERRFAGIRCATGQSPSTTEATIRKALKKGSAGIRKIATQVGVGTGTVQRIKAEMSA